MVWEESAGDNTGRPSDISRTRIFPARLLTGWAISRARRWTEPRHFIWQWGCRFAAIPVVAFYTLIVYGTQFISWNGAWNVLEQHAFLVPVPFLGL